MTLRQWVESAVDVEGSRAELEAFETGVLDAWWRAVDTGRLPRLPPLNASVDPKWWCLTFRLTRDLLKALGTPLGGRR